MAIPIRAEGTALLPALPGGRPAGAPAVPQGAALAAPAGSGSAAAAGLPGGRGIAAAVGGTAASASPPGAAPLPETGAGEPGRHAALPLRPDGGAEGPAGARTRGFLQPLLSRIAALGSGLFGAPSADAAPKAPPPPALPLFGNGPAGQPVPDALPSLRETLSALIQAQPALGEQIVRQVAPQPNAMLGATLMFFVAALRGGDVRGWLGERATKALEQAGRGDAVQRLGGEFSALARQAREPAGEFRPFLLPIYQDGEVNYLQMAVRRPPPDGGRQADGDAAGKRFLIEVEMSRTGPLQLDGLVKAKRFHLILRTHGPFPQAMRSAIREVFSEACEACGLQPSLAFQTGAEAWVRLGAEPARSGPSRAVRA
jgi:hypothetical protein